jgi:hypothetical protein
MQCLGRRRGRGRGRGHVRLRRAGEDDGWRARAVCGCVAGERVQPGRGVVRDGAERLREREDAKDGARGARWNRSMS